jgi:hypothetical protein
MSDTQRRTIKTVLDRLTAEIQTLPMRSPEREELKREREYLESMLRGDAA